MWVEGATPINNCLDRMLRLELLWRKKSGGSASAEGCRFVEWLQTVEQTGRLRRRSVPKLLDELLVSHRT